MSVGSRRHECWRESLPPAAQPSPTLFLDILLIFYFAPVEKEERVTVIPYISIHPFWIDDERLRPSIQPRLVRANLASCGGGFGHPRYMGLAREK